MNARKTFFAVALPFAAQVSLPSAVEPGRPHPVTPGRRCPGAYTAMTCLVLFAMCLFSGCRRNEMHQQAIMKPLQSSDFFTDGREARNPVPGTVARYELQTDHAFYEGKDAQGKLVNTFPFPVTLGVLQRGQQRFDIYCSVCHGYLGDGNGMIVQRGMIRPPSYHIDRLRLASVGHFYDVITNGYGAMYSYADRITPRDRWAIVAYIRALQLSQHSPANKTSSAQGTPGSAPQTSAPSGRMSRAVPVPTPTNREIVVAAPLPNTQPEKTEQ